MSEYKIDSEWQRGEAETRESQEEGTGRRTEKEEEKRESRPLKYILSRSRIS